MSAARAKRGVLPPPREVIEKLEKTVNDGNHYGALQMYKSYSVRYIAAERYTEALEILQSGALVQLNNGQVTCGAELAGLFVETLIKGKFPYNEEILGYAMEHNLHRKVDNIFMMGCQTDMNPLRWFTAKKTWQEREVCHKA